MTSRVFFGNLLEDVLGKLPEEIIVELLARELKDHGVKLSRREQQRLQKLVLGGVCRTLHLRRDFHPAQRLTYCPSGFRSFPE
jgi:hypothetical protein